MKYNVFLVENDWIDDDPDTDMPIYQYYDQQLYSVETDNIDEIVSMYKGVLPVYTEEQYFDFGIWDRERQWIEIRKEVH